MEVTLGGDRLGSGKKMKVYGHNFERANFNLSRDWRSSMAPGVLVPCFVDFMQPFDTFEIDMQSLIKTKPTIAPLYGAFKLQIDFFRCPARLYISKMHNNPVGIASKMETVLFPRMNVTKYISDYKTRNTSSSSLLNYLGLRNIGCSEYANNQLVARNFNAVPLLAYYDIFKNYYANKQEENAYVIGVSQKTENTQTILTRVEYGNSNNVDAETNDQINWADWNVPPEIPITNTGLKVTFYGEKISPASIQIDFQASGQTPTGFKTIGEQIQAGNVTQVGITDTSLTIVTTTSANSKWQIMRVTRKGKQANITYAVGTSLNAFKLKNLDDMREQLLTAAYDENVVTLGLDSPMPYSINFEQFVNNQFRKNEYPLNGLCVKTYQSDIFNNWLSKETTEATGNLMVDVTKGLNLDALNLAKKVYNMMNRIAVTGGTLDDWTEAVYGDQVINRCETPVYEGGMSSEIVFDEVVSSAATDEDALGTLAGRGFQLKESDKGGHVSIWSDEPCFIIGIASITPRIDYSQGNKWYLTRLMNLDDMHKPSLDGIGFENLMAEQLDGNAAIRKQNGSYESPAIGKLPAWMNYQTAVNDVYGDFADENKAGYMVLRRNYELGKRSGANGYEIKDATTYIDPKKFNYAFADTTIESQNFWTQIAFRVEARRKMSAKVIPNL